MNLDLQANCRYWIEQEGWARKPRPTVLVLGFTLPIYKRALLDSIASIVIDSDPFVQFNPTYVLYTLRSSNTQCVAR